MNKLLKEYDFNSDMQYYEMIVVSVINGQRTQAKTQFNCLLKENKKAFIKAIYGYWNTSLSQEDKEMFMDIL
jgi:hypothetical protein